MQNSRPSHRIRSLALYMTAACLAGCATIGAPKLLPEDESVKPVGSDAADPLAADPYITFNRALKRAQAYNASTADRNDLLLEGFGLIDYRCGRYFVVLGKAEQNLSFDRKQTSLTSGVVLSLAGLAKATTRSVSTAGALFSFASASMDSYEDVYLFSPDVKLVQDLVADSMSTYHSAFLKQVQPDSDIPMSAVWATLAQYESLCQPANIRNLVNKSVASVQTQAASAPDKAISAPVAESSASAPAEAASAAGAAASAAEAAASASAAAKAAKDKAAAASKAAHSAVAAASVSAAKSPASAASAAAIAKAAQAKADAAAKAASSTELAAILATSNAKYASALAIAASAAAPASAPLMVDTAHNRTSKQFVQPRIVIDVVPKIQR